MISTLKFGGEATVFVNDLIKQKSKVFVLVDENTHQHCWPIFAAFINDASAIEIIEIESGEENKQLSVFEGIIETLIELKADRNSLIINLGGGMITDMGGFVASAYMRGISYINIPTTLLAMADAAHGGKTGVDFKHYKNLLGAMHPSEAVLVYHQFLETLDATEYLSGYAEALKHGLISNAELWYKLSDYTVEANDINAKLPSIIEVKVKIVKEDPNEKNLRKTLNYGHSLGHAIESDCLEKGKPIPHGFAVVLGMVLENLMAVKQNLLAAEIGRAVNAALLKLYPQILNINLDIASIINNLDKDKKNSHGLLYYAPITEIGKALYNIEYNKGLAAEVLTAFKAGERYFIGFN